MSTPSTLQLTPAGAQPLTPAQKRFNLLVRKIETARAALAAWQEQTPLFAQAHAKQVQPLLAELQAARCEWVFALDGVVAKPGWTRAERDTLQQTIVETAGDLLDGDGDADAALKALYDKHADVDYDTDNRQHLQAMKGLFEAVSGVELGDDELASEEELFERAQARMAERAQAAEQTAQQAPPARERRKSAAERRRENEARQATQTVREVYRKLASTLHPDRAVDAAERDTKTALMQRVNQAYERNDLLALLELQLEIEQVDRSHIAGASAERMKHYNKVLAEQLEELQAETEAREMAFCAEYGLTPPNRLDPRKLGPIVQYQVRELRTALAEAQRERRMLADPAATKRWLKHEQRRQREEEFDDGPFF